MPKSTSSQLGSRLRGLFADSGASAAAAAVRRGRRTASEGTAGTSFGASESSSNAEPGPPWLVDEVHLMRSHLGPRPTYDRLASWSLAGVPG